VSGTSLKAALDLDWDDPAQQGYALTAILQTLEAVEAWVETAPVGSADPQVSECLRTARQVQAQDVELAADGRPALRRKVAKERRIAIEDAQMRHGRKSKHQRINGYKRHILRDLDSGLVRAVGVTPANAPEASVTEALMEDLAVQPVQLSELHIDRAYLSSRLVQERPPELLIYCKAWPVRNGDRFPKTAFHLDWQRQYVRCPNNVELPFELGGIVRFPAATCATCPWRERCTTSDHGRSVAIHPDERLRLRTASAATDAAGPREAARTGRRRAWPGPYWALAGAARPLSRQPEKSV
jgi:hypothetical protein